MNITAAIEHLQSLCRQLPIEKYQLLNGRSADILRLDTIDPVIQGNKAAKLLGHLQVLSSHLCQFDNDVQTSDGADNARLPTEFEVCSQFPAAILSFGGRYSNHLHALAQLGARFDIPIIGFVQGYPEQPLSHTLKDCLEWGMKLVLQNKQQYSQRYDSTFRAQQARHYQAWVIAEGGGADQEFADSGLAYWLPVLRRYPRVWLASGSGTTAASLMRLLNRTASKTQLMVVNCVADHGQLSQRVKQFNQVNSTHHRVIDTGHGGGFGRQLAGFSERKDHYTQQGLAIEPIYMDKLLTSFSQYDDTRSSCSELIIHGGGLQGNPRL